VDYESERLIQREDTLHILQAVYPGSGRKALRAKIQADEESVTEWATFMLKAMTKVLKQGSSVAAEYNAVLQVAQTGADPQWLRRSKTGLSLYMLNYAISLAMSRAPGAEQACIGDWTNARRKDKETAFEYRVRLLEIGLRQTPPVLSTEQRWKESQQQQQQQLEP
jgi:hypothetical protein